jgi:mRNA interferase RelE/StbE
MPFSVRVLDSAKEDLRRLDTHVALRILKKLDWLAENAENLDHTALKGELNSFCKLRDGDYRILYELIRREKLILVHAVGHRRDIYR